MKRFVLLLLVSASFFACDGGIKVNEEKIDAAGDKLQKTVEKGADSIAAKAERLKDKLDNDTLDR